MKKKKNSLKEKKSAILQRKNSLGEISGLVSQYNNDIKTWQNVHTQQDIYVSNLRNGIKELNTAKEKYSGEISKTEERKISAQSDYDGLINQLYEVYEMTRSEAEESAEKITDVISANKRLNEVKGKIRALGNVNVGAIEEYKRNG